MPFRNPLLVLAALCLAGAAGSSAPTRPGLRALRPSPSVLHRIPLAFEEFAIRDGKPVFVARTPDSCVWIRSGETILNGLRMRLLGAQGGSARGVDRAPGTVNYLLGRDPRRWRTGVTSYARVLLPGVYPGIDQLFYGAHRELEYDFLVAPGADPRQIRVEFTGAERVESDAAGDLLIRTAGGSLRYRKPVAYQGSGCCRRPVECRYEILPAPAARRLARSEAPPQTAEAWISGHAERSEASPAVSTRRGSAATATKREEILHFVQDDNAAQRPTPNAQRPAPNTQHPTPNAQRPAPNTQHPTPNAQRPAPNTQHPTPNAQRPVQVAFRLGDYNPTERLVIDPILSYSGYLGGSGNDDGLDIAVDAAGYIYVAGETVSADFPTANPFQAGRGGGSVRSDAFVSKLTPSGDALVYSTYLGGSGGDAAAGLAVDGDGSVYLAGSTDSTDFPVAGALQPTFRGGGSDGFVTKLNAAGNALAYSTYLGGRGADLCTDLAVDSGRSVYLTGQTFSDNFPLVNPLQPLLGGGAFVGDAFAAQMNPSGSALVYSTYLGGSGVDFGLSVAVDANGRAHIAGTTASNDFPTSDGAFDRVYGGMPGSTEAFAVKIDTFGAGLLYSTYLGGTKDENGRGIALEPDGDACVTGETQSTDFPTAFPKQAVFGGGTADAFLVRLTPSGGARYATYLGGSGTDSGRAVAMDGGGNAYLTGRTFSANFPVANPLRPHAGNFDVFVAKMNPSGSRLVFSTFLGGLSEDSGLGIAVGAPGSVYVTGATLSSDFPLAAPLQPEPRGNGDAFVAIISEGVSPPAVPTNLQVSEVCTTGLTLSWTDNSDNENAFEIERRTGAGPFVPIGAVEADTPTFRDSGLTPGAAYDYRVRATNGDGASPYSNSASAATLTSLPAAPGNLVATVLSATSVRLTWTDNSATETGFAIERSPDGIAFLRITTVAANVVQVNDTGLTPNTTYTYRVRATVSGCDSTSSNTATVTTPANPPAAPQGLTARAATEFRIDLTWEDHSDNETGFKIERKTGEAAFSQIQVTGPNVTTYADASLAPGTAYTYRVRATNADGDSAYTEEARATTPAPAFGKLQVPKTVSFGKVAAGASVLKRFDVRNASRNETMRVDVSTAQAPFAVVSGGGSAFLIVGGVRSVSVRFAPTAAGRFKGTITVTSTDRQRPSATVRLTGSAR